MFNLSPFSLPWGTEVFAKVKATNVYGDSDYSELGGGGIIVRVPDSPVNLSENYSERTPSTIGLTWTDGAENGGLQILDYRLSLAEVGKSFQVV